MKAYALLLLALVGCSSDTTEPDENLTQTPIALGQYGYRFQVGSMVYVGTLTVDASTSQTVNGRIDLTAPSGNVSGSYTPPRFSGIWIASTDPNPAPGFAFSLTRIITTGGRTTSIATHTVVLYAENGSVKCWGREDEPPSVHVIGTCSLTR